MATKVVIVETPPEVEPVNLHFQPPGWYRAVRPTPGSDLDCKPGDIIQAVRYETIPPTVLYINHSNGRMGDRSKMFCPVFVVPVKVDKVEIHITK